MKRALIALGAAGVVGVAVGVALLGSDGKLAPDTVTARTVVAVPAASGSVLAKAKAQSPGPYRAARAAGARIANTPDGRSFYVESPKSGGGGKTIVTFHGYLSTAFDDYTHWAAEAKRRGIRVIAIQWRLGKARKDSYTPSQMYTQARTLLRRAGVQPGQALLSGYSSAASRMYGLEYLDLHNSRMFSLVVGNAGGALPNYPGYDQVFGAPAGRKTLSGSRWILFCGGRDPDPDLTGCPVMRRTRAKIAARGGAIAKFIQDRRASHGGFYENQANTRAALDLF